MPLSSAASTADRLARIAATTRAVTCRYVLALALIGVLALGGFLALQRTITAHEATSSILSLTGNQSRLIQHAMSTVLQDVQALAGARSMKPSCSRFARRRVRRW